MTSTFHWFNSNDIVSCI